MKIKDGEYSSTDQIDEKDVLSTKDYDDENNESGEEDDSDEDINDNYVDPALSKSNGWISVPQ
eukprot:CAMPEP_0203690708 /NCGR_PEP_ID=MMETSP0091-20130426/3075_1 /ASSEMBLY_ACC=CAM_ASM_001089 /TAXON_ID=426623 /ORGANISM="Chaetoceros affinis, Strain CCMP159" /LENGTH=62 /DNA_ID=CAMNT_0050560953 /DNA_START=221 /DNA_END=409 /DNA_ORIENTATION=+